MMKYAIYDPSNANKVKCLVAKEEDPGDLKLGELQTSVSGWPGNQPSELAELYFEEESGTLLWRDLRNLEEAWVDVRRHRDSLLKDTDWMVTRSVEMGIPLSSPWTLYRQALRDVTLQANPFNITWPTKPSS